MSYTVPPNTGNLVKRKALRPDAALVTLCGKYLSREYFASMTGQMTTAPLEIFFIPLLALRGRTQAYDATDGTHTSTLGMQMWGGSAGVGGQRRERMKDSEMV